MSVKLEAGKYYRTASGHKVACHGKDLFGRDWYYMKSQGKDQPLLPREWTAHENGYPYAGYLSSLDIVSEWKELRKIEGWVNVYVDIDGSNIICGYRSCEVADSYSTYGRIACVKISCTEGDGLKPL